MFSSPEGTAADVIRFYAEGKIHQATDGLFGLMTNATDGLAQFAVACDIAEVTAQQMRDARCCEGAMWTVNPAIAELAEDGEPMAKARLWAARFHTAVVNEDTDIAVALWNALDEPFQPVCALIAVTAPYYGQPVSPHGH